MTALNVIKYGDFHLFFGELKQENFRQFEVWCEYYEPWELEDFPSIPRGWLEQHLFTRMRETNSHPFYATHRDIDYRKRTFLCVSAEVMLAGCKFEGYLFFSEGQVRSAKVFVEEKTYHLYENDLFDEENAASLAELSILYSKDLTQVQGLNFTIKSSKVSWLETEGRLEIPVG